MGEMPKTTSNALKGRRKDAEAERDPEELSVQKRSTGVTFETEDFEVTAGCIAASSESSETSSDGQKEDGQDKTYFAVSVSPKGTRTSRKRLKVKGRRPPAQKKMRVMKVEEEPLLPVKAEAAQVAAQEKENSAGVARKGTEQCELAEAVMLVMLILVAFVVFMHLALAVVITVGF